MSRLILSLGFLACVFKVSVAVSCTTATASTCLKTSLVTATCSSDVCTCATGYTAVASGCAVSGETTVEKPVIVSGSDEEFGGQVLNGQTITLTCKHNYTTTTPTYAWQEDGSTASSLGTAQTADVAVNSDTYSKTYACVITVGGNSITSDTFAVTGFADQANAVTGVPYVSGVPESVTSSGNTFDVVCKNLPVATPTVTWTIDGSSAGTGVKATITFDSAKFGKTIKCSVTTASTNTLATPDSPTLTFPSAHASAELIEEVSVALAPTAPAVGGYMAGRCLVRAATLDGISYYWRYDDDPIPGQIDHTIQKNALVDANDGNGKKYKCYVKKDLYATSAETSTLTLAATPVCSVTGSSFYGTGNSYSLSCTSTSESPGIVYQWKRTISGGSEETLSETSKTLSITATTTSTDYKCAAKIGSSGTLGSDSSAETVLGTDMSTTVTVTGPTKPVAATSVTYTCVVTKADSASVTYRWLDADNSDTALSGETSSTYTFTAGSATTVKTFKCEATPSGGSASTSTTFSTTAQASTDTPSIAESVTDMGGTKTVQTGGSYTLTCNSLSATGQSSAVYEWKLGTTVLGSTSSTYTISSASSTSAGDYTCKVTMGSSQSSASTAVTLAHSTVLGKYCSAISGCTSDFTSYTGNCIASRCECQEDVPLNPTMCGSTSSSGTTAVASMMFVFLATLISRLF